MHGLAGFDHFLRVPFFVEVEISGEGELLLDEMSLPNDHIRRDEANEQGTKTVAASQERQYIVLISATKAARVSMPRMDSTIYLRAMWCFMLELWRGDRVRPEELGVFTLFSPVVAGVPPPPATGHSGPVDPVGKAEDRLFSDC